MRLPGGLWEEGRLATDFAFRPVTGELELALAECRACDESVPTRVTRALSATLRRVAGHDPSTRVVGRLCVADRQHLMRQLAIRLGMDDLWLTASCRECGAAFDASVKLSVLPVKPAGDGFPFAEVDTSRGRVTVRVPCGDDQAAIAGLPENGDARRALIGRCIVGGDPAATLTEEDRDAIDSALEAVSPELVVGFTAPCPECGAKNEFDLDPYLPAWTDYAAIFTDVHALAAAYGWTEQEILKLPRDRRRLYISLVDRSRGLTT